MFARPEMTDKGHRVAAGFIENAVINTQSTTRSGLRFRPPHRTYLSVDNFHDEGTGSRCDEKCQSLLPTLYMLMISVR